VIWYFAPILFLSGVTTDLLWTPYIQAVADKRMLTAGLYSVGTGVISIVFVEGIILDMYSMPFWLVGLFVGTYFSDNFQKFVKGRINVYHKNRKLKIS
jgi:hypothetical protein